MSNQFALAYPLHFLIIPFMAMHTLQTFFIKRFIRKNKNRLYGDHVSVTVEPAFVKWYRKILVNRGFCKKKLDTRFDTHCIKTGVQLWWAIRDSNPGPTGYEPVALTN